jgi:hypothetical protein
MKRRRRPSGVRTTEEPLALGGHSRRASSKVLTEQSARPRIFLPCVQWWMRI